MTMRILGVLGLAGTTALIALSARDSLSREAERGRALARVPVVSAQRPAVTAASAQARPVRGEAQPAAMTPQPDGSAASAPDAEAAPAAEAHSTSDRPSASAQGTPQAILTRAAAAYGRVRSLRADFVQVTRNPLLGSTTTSRGALFQRRPDRLLLRFSQPQGDVLVSDGQFFWVYYPSVDPKQVIRMPAARGGGGLDLQAQFLGDPVRRFNATLVGTESVGRRPANVLRLVPRAEAAYKELKVWLDRGDNLARRFEITELNGSIRRFELNGLRVNTQLSDALFRFHPPAGAHIVDQS